jgi:hypothetical protein
MFIYFLSSLGVCIISCKGIIVAGIMEPAIHFFSPILQDKAEELADQLVNKIFDHHVCIEKLKDAEHTYKYRGRRLEWEHYRNRVNNRYHLKTFEQFTLDEKH